jgi:hypothetical protein
MFTIYNDNQHDNQHDNAGDPSDPKGRLRDPGGAPPRPTGEASLQTLSFTLPPTRVQKDEKSF